MAKHPSFKVHILPRIAGNQVVRFYGRTSDVTTWEAHFTSKLDSPWDEESLKKIGLSATSSHLQTITLEVEKNTFIFHRGGRDEPKPDFFDQIHFLSSPGYGELHETLKNEIFREFSTRLTPLDPIPTKNSLQAAPLIQLSTAHNAILERLEQANLSLFEENQRLQQKRDQEYEERISVLEQRKEAMEIESSKKTSAEVQYLNDEFIERSKELDGRKTELDQRENELDTSSNTFARRQIRMDILQKIQDRTENSSVSAGTKKLRWPIFITMSLLVIFFISMTIYTVWEIKQFTGGIAQLPAFYVIKQIFYSLGFVASMLYFIRWLNRWLRQHADAEFQIRQFQLDIERASWVVETSLEWSTETEKDIPEHLVRSLTKNLFTEGAVAESAIHPADQLASALFGSASNVKLKSGENEIEIIPKKLKRSGELPQPH